jgi:hypothetical protein
MVSKCANPACSTPFQYMREGKLFRFEDLETLADRSRPHLVGERKTARRTEHFWLCGPCSLTVTVSFDSQRGIVVVPIAMPLARTAAAS